MRRCVEEKRKTLPANAAEEDTVLPGLNMANHIYDSCTSRFVAADESNAKAEASVFADTGLMALVCRHDRVLFLINLQDAGEKQYNALALLKRLFAELPPKWRVGVLYDIGCQLHNSMVKVSEQLHFRNLIEHNLYCSIISYLTASHESFLGLDASMHLVMNLHARRYIILRNVLDLGILMVRDVRDAGVIFRKKSQPYAFLGSVECYSI